MDFFPISLDIKNSPCTVIGGGRVAARKAAALLDAGAIVRAISPEASPELLALCSRAKFSHQARPYRKGDLNGAFLVIAATDDEEIQAEVWQEARELKVLVNVADVPRRCNFILPATMNAGDLNISISTGGKSPALARFIRKKIEAEYSRGYPEITAIMGALRPFVLGLDLGHEQNRELFSKLLHADFLLWIRGREWDKIKNHIQEVLARQLPTDLKAELVTIVRGSEKIRGGVTP